MPRRLAILTAGGDAPGMNAAIRAVVRTANGAGIEVIGARGGFAGVVYGDFMPLTNRSVSNVIQQGGTLLETSRSAEFSTVGGRARAAENLRYRAVNGLIVLGGDGSLAAARAFASEHPMPVMFIPATIDNDMPGTDNSIGFDTAVNTALEAIDRIRDTAFASERLFFVEVMGRDSGFIAISVAIGGGGARLYRSGPVLAHRRRGRQHRLRPLRGRRRRSAQARSKAHRSGLHALDLTASAFFPLPPKFVLSGTKPAPTLFSS